MSKNALQKNTAYWIARIEHRTVPIERCIPHPRNPREHPPDQIRDLRASYRRFGQYRSLVGIENAATEGDVWIAAGCGTLTAMNEEHASTVDVGFLPPETPPDVVEGIMVADNNLSSKATDNTELLAMLLQEQQDAGYDLASLGTDGESLRQMLEATTQATSEDWGSALGDLPEGEKSPFQQMTFTLTNEQADTVKEALNLALEDKDNFGNTGNLNSNGNALAYIVKFYLDMESGASDE